MLSRRQFMKVTYPWALACQMQHGWWFRPYRMPLWWFKEVGR